MRLFLAKCLGLLIEGIEKLKTFLGRFSRRTYGLVAVILVCVILLLDVGYHFAQGFTSSMETMSARVGTLGESVSFDAYFVREEKVLAGDAERCLYYVADGEKVKKGMTLAAIYPEHVDQDTLLQLKRVSEAKKILESVSDARPEKVSETLALRIEGVNLLIEEAMQSGNLKKAARERQTLLALMLGREYMIGLMDVKKTIDTLSSTVKMLEGELGEPEKLVVAQEVGWFFYEVDGYEALASVTDCATMDFDALAELFVKKENLNTQGIGRLITSHQLYAVSFVDLEALTYFSKGKQYSVTPDRNTVTMTLEKIVKKEGENRAALVFSSRSLSESLSLGRIATMSMTVKQYEGFKIPTSAYAECKGVKGVYILKGFVVEFREISIIYRKDSMMIAEVSPDERSGQFLLLGENDNIIIKGGELYDGKIVQGAN